MRFAITYNSNIRKDFLKVFREASRFSVSGGVSAKRVPSKTGKSCPHSVLSLFEVVPRSPKDLQFLPIMSV